MCAFTFSLEMRYTDLQPFSRIYASSVMSGVRICSGVTGIAAPEIFTMYSSGHFDVLFVR